MDLSEQGDTVHLCVGKALWGMLDIQICYVIIAVIYLNHPELVLSRG